MKKRKKGNISKRKKKTREKISISFPTFEQNYEFLIFTLQP